MMIYMHVCSVFTDINLGKLWLVAAFKPPGCFMSWEGDSPTIQFSIITYNTLFCSNDPYPRTFLFCIEMVPVDT